MKIDGKGFTYTKDAWEYLQHKQLLEQQPKGKRGRPFGKDRKPRLNASKRKFMQPYLREQVYKRSNKQCELCGNKGDAIHHIRSVYRYPEQQFDLDNLIHLCVKCHSEQHINMKPILFLENKFRTL